MGIKLKNNAVGFLSTSITESSTQIYLQLGHGDLFPVLGPNDYFYATLVDVNNNFEIVKVIARSGDVLTVQRGAENTTIKSFPANSRVELRITVANIEELLATTSTNSTNSTNLTNFEYKGDWSASTSYLKYNVVYVPSDNSTYICLIDHTSGTDFNVDKAAGKWGLIASGATSGGSITDPELLAIAALTSDADKLPYFTGPGTAALTDFTQAARDLLASTSFESMRTLLGVTASTAFQIIYVTTGDFNTLTETGFYRGYFTANSPLPYPMDWYVDVKDITNPNLIGTKHILQIAVAASEGTHDGRVFVRFHHNGIWFPWSELIGTEPPDFIGAVGIANLSNNKSIFIDVIGDGTLFDFGSTSLPGTFKFLTFTGTTTLVHDLSKLVLPGNANIITLPGDSALFTHTGSGVWKCVFYHREATNILGDLKNLLNAPGTAPYFVCRAWLHFDAVTTPPTINQDGNISSVTDMGSNIYRISFTTPMLDYHYSVVGMTSEENGPCVINYKLGSMTASYFDIVISPLGTATTINNIFVAVFR